MQILLVEDSQGDAELIRLALEEDTIHSQLVVAEDGVEALRYLRCQDEFRAAARPDLILLDLNLPRLNGREVLSELKRDPELQAIPVIVLSSSVAREDVMLSYQLHANCYLQKPTGLPAFAELLERVQRFWFATATLPTFSG